LNSSSLVSFFSPDIAILGLSGADPVEGRPLSPGGTFSNGGIKMAIDHETSSRQQQEAAIISAKVLFLPNFLLFKITIQG
jgi:hypothetical protein